jgi:hypothetical protein
MPSDRGFLAWLRSQGLGVACGLSTVVLLAAGSFVLAATREGASARVAMDDVRAFFDPPSWVHLWFYLLVTVLGLYALNVLLATWHSVARKWRAGDRAPSAYAPAVLHLSFLVALLAHGVGGLLGGERGRVVVAGGFAALPDGREARLVSLDVDVLPGGMPKEVRARLALRGPAGADAEAVVGYDAPLSSGLGSDLWFLAEQGHVAGARLASGSERCLATEGTRCRFGDLEVELLAAWPPGRVAAEAVARLRLDSGGQTADRWVSAGRASGLPGSASVVLEGVEGVPAVLLRGRHAPGNPWALAAAVLLAGGVALLWRRFLPPSGARSAPAPEEDDDEPPPGPESGD